MSQTLQNMNLATILDFDTEDNVEEPNPYMNFSDEEIINEADRIAE